MADQNQTLSARAQASLGLPPTFKLYTPFPFQGMNQQASRIGMEDTEFFLLENLLKVGNGAIRAMWDLGAPVFTLASTDPRTMVSFFFFSGRISTAETSLSPYAIMFFNDGTATVVNILTGALTVVTTVTNTFYTSGGALPVCCEWGPDFLLIANNFQSNNYYLWHDGLLYQAGTLGPVFDLLSSGNGIYATPPTVTLFGGHGTGATAAAIVANGFVTDVNIINPGTGYEPGDIVQASFSGGGVTTPQLVAVLGVSSLQAVQVTNGGSGYSSPPAVTFTGGGGSGAAASAVIADGVVTAVIVTAGGSGYTSDPTVVFSSGAATGQAILQGGAVTSITVVAAGSGLTNGTYSLNIVGGGGSGAVATAHVSGGAVASAAVSSGGTGYIFSPGVEFPSSASNGAAAVASVMPFGVSGIGMETYQSRVWISWPYQPPGADITSATFSISAPGSFTDFATSDGGLVFQSTDRFLRTQFTTLRQSNGYLYPIGDSSTSVISNVQTSGSPATTTFNYQNTDPQLGTVFRDSCQDYSRTVIMTNQTGVYGLYGGAVTRISKKLDTLFTQVLVPPTPGALLPSAAVANIYTIRCYLVLVTLIDPIIKVARNVMLCWDETQWVLASQSANLIYIGTQEINSTNTAWGTDGRSLYPLFSTPSNGLIKRISSKLYGAADFIITKQATTFYVQLQNNYFQDDDVAIAMTCDNELASYPIPAPPSLLLPIGQSPVLGTRSGDIPGQELGFTLQFGGFDFTVVNLGLGVISLSALYG